MSLYVEDDERPNLDPRMAIIEEVLSTVLVPDRVEKVIREALSAADLTEVPRTAVELEAFVDGALFATLARHLDIGDGLEVVTQIRASLALVLETDTFRPVSDVRSATRVTATARRVLVATRASLVVFLLQDVLGDEVDVFPIADETVLTKRLALEPTTGLIVVDRKHSCLETSACSLLRKLDPRATVMWWGGTSTEVQEVTRQLAGGPNLHAFAEDASLADLSDMVRALMLGA